jgi:hypothetical protein
MGWSGVEQVFVPNAPSAMPPRSTAGSTAEDVELLREEASAQLAPPAVVSQQADREQMPDWWSPSPAMHVSLFYKQEVCSPTTKKALTLCAPVP